MHRLRTLALVGVALLLYPSASRALDEQEQPPAARCTALLEQASGFLGDEQYPSMLRIAKERQRWCPGPVSAFLVGLAQGNMVDNWIEEDPAQRELLRREAVRNLQVATAGGHALRPVWRFTAHDWLVYLRRMAPGQRIGQRIDQGLATSMGTGAFGAKTDAFTDDYGNDYDDAYEDQPMQLPPPPKRPQFPLGPLVVGGLSTGILAAALVTGLDAADMRATLRSNERILAEVERIGGGNEVQIASAMAKTATLHDRIEVSQNWSTILLVVGSLGAVTALTWYFALPPSDGWQWAVTPTGVQASARF